MIHPSQDFEVGWRSRHQQKELEPPQWKRGSCAYMFDLLVLNISLCEIQVKQKTYWMVVLAEMSLFLL